MTRMIPLKMGFVNAYLLRGESGCILIDTGMSSQWKKLARLLARAGCEIGELRLVLLTHGDTDHAGSCARLQKTYGLPVALHAGDVPMVRDGVYPKRTATMAVMKLLVALRSLRGKNGLAKSGRSAFTPDILLTDGQSLCEYGIDATVYHIPGHSQGSVAVLTDAGELIAGDAVANFSRPSVGPLIEDFAVYRDCLKRLISLNARVVYPGHGAAFPAEELVKIAGTI